jgi:hypothetical protein
MRVSRTAATLVIILLLASFWNSTADLGHDSWPGAELKLSEQGAPSDPAAQQRVQIDMRNVRLHVDEGIVLDIARLRGEMISRSAAKPPVFDDRRSYVLDVSAATMSIDMDSLGALMNRHVFAYEDAPLKDLKIKSTDDGRLEQSGKLHKGIDLPFSMKASVSSTPDGRLKLHMESMKAAGIPATRVLDLFGLELEDLADLERRRGVSVHDNDIIISVGQVLPPPEIRGHLTRVTVEKNRVFQTFARTDARRAADLRPPDRRARNYIYFSGGSITFGKLTMKDTDLQLIDADMRDPFDFFPAKYERQLVAGYSKNTPARGLKTYLPDYADLDRPASRDLRPARPNDRRNGG